jgi:hypothetical protein
MASVGYGHVARFDGPFFAATSSVALSTEEPLDAAT